MLKEEMAEKLKGMEGETREGRAAYDPETLKAAVSALYGL